MNIVSLSRQHTPIPLRPVTSLPRCFSQKTATNKLRYVTPKFDPQRISANPPSFSDLVIKPSLSQFPKLDISLITPARGRASTSRKRGLTERKKENRSPVRIAELKGARFPLHRRRLRVAKEAVHEQAPEQRTSRKMHMATAETTPESPQMSRWVGSTHDSPLVIRKL